MANSFQQAVKICLFVVALLTLAGTSQAAWQHQNYVSDHLSIDYAVHVPTSDSERLPIILFMHGAGERGSNLNHVLSSTVPDLLRATPDSIIVVPQVPKEKWWTDLDIQKFTLQVLERVIREHSGDRTRLYLVGVSMGGHGAIHLSAANPDTFAAVLAMCARLKRPKYVSGVNHLETNPIALAKSLKHTPIWLSHGDRDQLVPVRNSRRLNKALIQVGGDVLYTEIPGGSHNIWGETLRDGLALHWLLQQQRQRTDQVSYPHD